SGTRATLRNTGGRLNEDDLSWPSPRVRRYPSTTYYQAGVGIFTVRSMVDEGVLPIDFAGGVASPHPRGAHFLFWDGSVRLLKQSIDQGVYQSLGNRADGALVSDDRF